MAGSWTADRFPQFEASIRGLTNQHRELVDEPLYLAISYFPASRDPDHIFLFEVIGGVADRMTSERDLFETTFLPSSGFPMGPNEQLHLVLTNPHELEIGIREDWPLVSELVDAIHRDDYKVLYADDTGLLLLEKLREAANHPEAIRG